MLTEQSREIFQQFVNLIQQCEEAQGPEGMDYVLLMQQIASEASYRANNAIENLR